MAWQSALTILLIATITTSGATAVGASNRTKVVKLWGACGGLSGTPKGIKGVTGTWAGYCCVKGAKCAAKSKFRSVCIPRPAVECGAGQRLVGGKCATCPVNTWARMGDNICTKCKAGTASPGGSAVRDGCMKCLVMQYSKAGGSCKPCPNGQYTMVTGSASCKVCKKKMALSTVPASKYDHYDSFNDVNDYYICQPGKPIVHKYCGVDRVYNPIKQCCVVVTHAFVTERCIGKPVLAG